MTAGMLLLVAVVSLFAGIVLVGRWPRLWLGLTLVAASSILGAALMVLGGGEAWEWRSGFQVGGERLHLRLDGISGLFLALLSVIGAAGAVYAREYWSDRHHAGSAGRGRLWWSAMLLSMVFVLLSSNGLHFLIAWELFAVSSYFLITLDRDRRAVRAAGWLYLGASHAGTLCLFGFFALLASRTGSWDLGPMQQQKELAPLVWLALGGFAVKAGLFPVHLWLPSAHANAPSHVSALMSGVAIKMGIYGIIRFTGWLPVPAAAGGVIIGLGAVSALLGIAFAFAQNDLKRLLAYCSVENVGIISMGIGGALLGAAHGNATWGSVLLAGALFHVWNHGLFKSLLFLVAGSVLHATGTREMSRLGGLWRSMPWTAAMYALGAAAIAGLPPLNGFVSEWLVYVGLFDAAAGRGVAAGAAMPAVLMLAMAGALALATFVKAGAVIFLGTPRTDAVTQARESGSLMRGAMLALTAGCAGLGLAPLFFWPAIARAVGAWNPAWPLAEPPVPLGTLGGVQVIFAIFLLGGGVWLWRKAHANGLRRGLTWDCGLATPTARMQYTSGSFSDTAGGWFNWILRPQRVQRRPHGSFAVGGRRIERVPETVLEHVVEPAAAIVMRLSGAARRLQHGRLQFYLMYLAGGLAVLAILVWFGGKP
jgi:hydrogenase-4 component B